MAGLIVALQSIETAEGIFIVLSNLFVLSLFYQDRRGVRFSNCHIISLVFSDVLQGLINVPAVIYLTRYDVRVGDPSCFWTIWIATTSAFTQIFIIVTMTVDRYWAIVYTLHYRKNMTKHLTYGLISISWFIGIGLGIFGLFFRISPNDNEKLCFMVEEMFNSNYSSAVALILIVPSHLVIAVLYIRIYRFIIQTMRKFSSTGEGALDKIRKIVVVSSGSNNSTGGNSKTRTGQHEKSDEELANLREIRTMFVITMIVVLYFVGWLPTVVLFVLTKLNKMSTTAFLISAILNHLHSALNPFLYALNIRERKIAAKKLVKRLVCLA